MLAATRVKMSDKEKKLNKNTSDISFMKRVTRMFHVVVVQNNAKEMYNEKVCCTCKVTFLLIRPIVVFFLPFSLRLPLSIIRFYILFEQIIKIIESFAFSPG